MAETNLPEFGLSKPSVAYLLRPGGYVVIRNDNQQIAIVKAPGGYYLPGGKQEPGESLEAAAIRETAEECGLQIEIQEPLGTADELVYAESENQHYRKRGSFFTAVVVGTAPSREPDHELFWLPVPQAVQSLLHDSQRWAVRQACSPTR